MRGIKREKNMKYTEQIDERLFYNKSDLTQLAINYGTPLKITYLDLIKNKIENLKNIFDDAINEKKYSGKFIYLNANKANYSIETIGTSLIYSDGLETSSYNDLLLTIKIMKKNKAFIKKPIVCNGVKDQAYLDEIISLNKKGFDITCIIDNKKEYEYLNAKIINSKLKVGLRVHLTSLYSDEDAVTHDDRFGLIKRDFDFLVKEIKKNKKFILTTVHFHQRGFEFNEKKFFENFKIVFENFYVNTKKEISTLTNLNMGGGTPILLKDEFNYNSWANILLTRIQAICDEQKIATPNLVTENGKYTVKDSTVLIYEIIAQKCTDGKTPWYIINGSFFSAIAEYYEAGEDFVIEPINLLNNKMINVRLAGLTCDCDDIYYEKKGIIKMPIINDGEKLYIAVLGCGSYQDSMQGRGGVHHCLMSEEARIIFDLNGKAKLTNKLQNIKDIMKVLK